MWTWFYSKARDVYVVLNPDNVEIAYCATPEEAEAVCKRYGG